MTTVKFDKTVKYAGVRHPAHEVFKVDDKDVDKLKEAGATVIATEPDAPQFDDDSNEDGGDADEQEADSDKDVDKLKEELLEYTVPALTAFAQERGIDLQGKTRKADIYNIIVAALH